MALTGRQIRQLRSLAHHLEPVITVGKQGVAPAVVDQANAALEAHELIKCSALENSGLSAREAADQLAELTGYIGGLKEVQYSKLMSEKPEKAMQLAIEGMLPNNTLGRKAATRMRLYAGAEHKNGAQKPEEFKY